MAPAAAGTAQPTNGGISAGRRVANARPAEESVDNLLGCLAVESDPSSPGLAGELRRPCTPSKLRRTTGRDLIHDRQEGETARLCRARVMPEAMATTRSASPVI